MDTAILNPQSEPSNDVFSLTDEVLSERLEFMEEIGFGNWGSVWLCRPKAVTAADGTVKPPGQKLAIKLVHRSKTPTTAARVRSLWNEMKIIKSLKSELHPSIIPFHSFIITPSYALITMSYLPTLIPVEVEESKAREWFRLLLSGVEFLHTRGVVHNDIKPANILLSHKNIPVMVDFGFAEKYDTSSDTAFHSNLSYGTPEYLSPERARGLPHDTRKSDIWSLGVTFFEILVGRTPFETSDGEQISSKEDLEKYWERTMRGKWVGKWSFSQGVERLLQRMVSPNADLRCNAKQAMADMYWRTERKEHTQHKIHKRASSYASTSNSSVVFERDIDKLLSMTPSSSYKGNKVKASVEGAKIRSPPGLDLFQGLHLDSSTPAGEVKPKGAVAQSKSQPRVAGTSNTAPSRRRALAPADLSPIKASPTTSPAHRRADSSLSASTKAKENISHFNKLAASVNTPDAKKTVSQTRAPLGALSPNNGHIKPKAVVLKKPSGHSHGAKAVKVLGDKAADSSLNNLNASYSFGMDVSVMSGAGMDKSKDSTNVKDRMKDWEREKERLREMERLEELEKERDEMYRRQKEKEKKRRAQKAKEEEQKCRKEELIEVSKEETQPELPKTAPVLEKQPSENSVAVDFEKEIEERVRERKHPAPLALPSRYGGSSQNHGHKKASKKDHDADKENIKALSTTPVIPMFYTGPRLTQVFNISMETPPPATRIPKANKGSFKHGIKASIDKTIEFCKTASVGHGASGRTTPARGFSFDVTRPSMKDNTGKDGREGWEFEPSAEMSEVSPLPGIKNIEENGRIAADARNDRMAIWMRNVEKVVEDAKQNFASATPKEDIPLPPLPAPLARNASQSRTSRLPRRILAASQIFQSDESGNIVPMIDQSLASETSAFFTANDLVPPTPVIKTYPKQSSGHVSKVEEMEEVLSEQTSQAQILEIHTPSRQRRATVSIGSPSAVLKGSSELEVSPSKRREKSKSQSNIFQMHIAPVSFLEAELAKTPPPPPTPRLAEVIDRNLFIAPPFSSRDDLLEVRNFSLDDSRRPYDELTASPYHVEPYPQRYSHDVPHLDTPARHKIEGVYDRFLMATSGVKRLGKGYQSESLASSTNRHKGVGLGLQVPQAKARPFYSTRRPMPPPVSSEDLRRMTASVDELGNINLVADVQDDPYEAKEGFMRKAIKLMAPKANSSKRTSRIY